MPPVPEGAEHGWFAYAPMRGGAYGGLPTLEPESQPGHANDAGDQEPQDRG